LNDAAEQPDRERDGRERDGRLHTDRELVAAFLAQRAESAFRALYRRHTPALYRCARRLVGGGTAEAEDIVQETWLRALDSIATFRGDARLGTWLVGIALNCVREAARRGRREPAALEGEPEGTVPDPPAFDGASVASLEQAIAELPLRYREVIVLHDIEQHTHAEVARLLGIEVGTSKSQLARARRTLRGKLSERASSEREDRS